MAVEHGLEQNLVADVYVAVANIFSLKSFLVFSSLIRVHILVDAVVVIDVKDDVVVLAK